MCEFCEGTGIFLMKFIDLQKQYQLAKPKIDAAIQAVLDHGLYILGPEVVELEKTLAERVGVRHCIAVSSGTDALLVALKALGIGAGDEVIMPAFSFFATAEMVLLLGAQPVYVDIDPFTYNIDPALIEAAITPHTKALLPVSMFGQCADMTTIQRIAARHGLPVIEDAAQSFGATHQGQPSCGFPTVACTSFFPSKPLGCYGDAGACFTNDDALAHQMRMLMNHGQEARYEHVMVGLNARCDSIQAAILLAKLANFDEEMQRRQEVASWYGEQLGDALRAPQIASGNISTFAQYTIQVSERDKMRAQLAAEGIPTAVHYPKGLHQQPASYTEVAMPVTETVSSRVLSLPFHPYLTQAEVRQIATVVMESYHALAHEGATIG